MRVAVQLVDLVARIMALVPPWVRIYRIQRDIPMPLVTSGVEKGNLRELSLARMGQLGLKCRDVRTREAGIQDIHHQVCFCPFVLAHSFLLQMAFVRCWCATPSCADRYWTCSVQFSTLFVPVS